MPNLQQQRHGTLQAPGSRRDKFSSITAAAGDSQDADVKQMNTDEARELLGLAPTSSFDQAMKARDKRMERYKDDPEKSMQVEAAYDVLLMDNMKRRLSGEAAVAKSVRFADVPKPRKKVQVQPPRLPGNLAIARPRDNQELATQSAVFGLLAVWTLAQALTTPPSQLGMTDTGTPGLQLAVACAASLYFLRQNKRLGLGRAAALTGGGFVLGTILGAVIQNWLRVDIVPLGSFSSPGALVGELSILGLWFACTFVY
jgi:hypothetical protein